jgi:putative membrane protein insertion efficiency factor
MSPVAYLLKFLVRGYQLTFSAFLGRQCRFAPSCSEYAMEAIERHGAWRGTTLAVRRVARCHPFGGSGFDPVPESPDSDRTPVTKDLLNVRKSAGTPSN